MSIDPFNPIAIAKEVIGNLTDAIKATERDMSVAEPQGRATFNAALLLQAGLRALLPVGEREGVALPRIFPTDAQELQDAQRNYAAVFESGKEATPEKGAAALEAIRLAAKQLSEQGYKKFASVVVNAFKETQEATLPQLTRRASGQTPAPQ
jgi:hypothetical protein